MKLRLLAGIALATWFACSRTALAVDELEDGEATEPDSFETVVSLARSSLQTATDLKKKIDKTPVTISPEEMAKLMVDRYTELNKAQRNFELAFTLIIPTDDTKNIAAARLHYAHTSYYLHRNYEAAVLGQYVARTAPKDDSNMALDGAYIAMAAFARAYNENNAPTDQKTEDMHLLIKSANFIAERWPSSDKANDAVMILGRILSTQKKPAEAAEFFGRVPESDSKYAEAQLAAGQAYWTAYSRAGQMAERPPVEKLSAWLKSAEQHLRKGIETMEKQVPAQGVAPGELIAAKLSLSQIIIPQGKEAEALKLLLNDPHSVVKAVFVEEGTTRPEMGVKSTRFALEAYKLLLRAYMGTDNLEKARETTKELEKLVGGEKARETMKELEKLVGK